MAGESPDRSKQREHESSAAPTPGAARTVPGGRDPRVSVLEPTPARGTVNTAEEPPEAPESPEKDSGDRKPAAETPEGRTEPPEGSEEETARTDSAADTDSGKTAAAEKDDTQGDDVQEDAAPEADAPKVDEKDEAPEEEASTEEAPKKDEKPTPKADAEIDAPKDDAPEGDAPDDAPKSDEPIDQPTAIFKAPKPKPHVDQPTTMLKLGDVPKKASPKDDAPKAAPKAAPKDDAETVTPKADDKPKADDGQADDAAKSPSAKVTPAPEKSPGAAEETPSPEPAEKPAERTSKFVALKPLDEPAARKPRPATAATSTPAAASPAATTPESTAVVPQVGPERTTQQPLPPKPPLDLLAELTNTPPPPPTPLRTLARRVKIWTPLVVLLAIVFAVAQNLRPLPQPTLDLTAQDSYTFAGGKVDIAWPASGQAALDVQGVGTFGSSGDQKPVPIASVAKVMTAYLILRDHPLKSGAEGPKITIDKAAQDQSNAGQESTVDVTAGDSITQREALEGILIASANNVARLLARWDAGSEAAFVKKMNAAAKELGMTNTTYTDPSGLTDSTVSTAVDQVKLGRAAMELPVFREVAAMMSYDDYKGVNHSNWNQLVGHNNVVGIKTGTTTSALGNLMFAAKKDVNGQTRTIVGAVVRQPAGGTDNTILSAALTAGDSLIRAAQQALESAVIIKKGAVVGYVDDGLGGRTPVVATQDVTAVGWAGLKVKLSFAAGELPHTAKAGTQVGTLTVGDGGSDSAVKVPVALGGELAEPGFGAKLTRLG